MLLSICIITRTIHSRGIKITTNATNSEEINLADEFENIEFEAED